MLAPVSDKTEPSVLLGPIVLWNINIADFAVLGEELLDIVDVGAVGKPVHLQAYHPACVGRGTTP